MNKSNYNYLRQFVMKKKGFQAVACYFDKLALFTCPTFTKNDKIGVRQLGMFPYQFWF